MKLSCYWLAVEVEHQDKINVDDNACFVVNTKPEITLCGFVRIVDKTGYVYKIDATFDFSKVPQHLHQLGLQMAMIRGCSSVYYT